MMTTRSWSVTSITTVPGGAHLTSKTVPDRGNSLAHPAFCGEQRTIASNSEAPLRGGKALDARLEESLSHHSSQCVHAYSCYIV